MKVYHVFKDNDVHVLPDGESVLVPYWWVERGEVDFKKTHKNKKTITLGENQFLTREDALEYAESLRQRQVRHYQELLTHYQEVTEKPVDELQPGIDY